MKTKIINILILVFFISVCIGLYLLRDYAEPNIGAKKEIPTLDVKKEDILKSKDVDWIEFNDGDPINKGKIIRYDYKTNIKVKDSINNKIVKDIDNYSNHIKLDDGYSKFITGDAFWYDGKDWFEIKRNATTTLDIWDKEILEISWFDKLFIKPVYATEVLYYSGAGDGLTYNKHANDWDTVHNATTASNGANYTAALEFIAFMRYRPSNEYSIMRGYLPIDTSGLPDGAVIASATISIESGATNRDSVTSGSKTVTIVQTDQPDPTVLAAADYNNCGATDNPDEGIATRRAFSDLVATDDRDAFLLDATGRGWIVDDGYSMFGFRTGWDVDDSSPTDKNDTGSGYAVKFSEDAQEAERPYILIEYSEAPPAGGAVRKRGNNLNPNIY